MRKGLLALMLGGAALVCAPAAMVAAQNWNVEYSKQGNGHLVGNPDAPVKLTTFVSYSCPACASFEIRSDAPLRAAYIHEGKVQVEVRHVIRSPVDLAAALITECGPQDKFFDNHRRIIFAQSVWLYKVENASQAQINRWTTGPTPARMRAIAADLKFYDLMETRGYSRSELDRCLSDVSRADALAEASEADKAQFGVPRTPSFAINGTLLAETHSWSRLQPAIDAALAQGE